MQEARPRRLGERTVDYGLAAMDFCGTLPRTAAGVTRRPAAEVFQQPTTSSATASREEVFGLFPLNAELMAVGG